MSTTSRKIVLGVISTTAIMTVGFGCMTWLTPKSDEALLKEMSPEVRKQVELNRNKRKAQNEALIEYLKEQSKADKPIWSTTPNQK